MGRTSDAAERLVTAIANLNRRSGYAEMGVDEVCREAGVKKGSFSHFFPSKRALMLAALQYQQRRLGPKMLQAFDPPCPPRARFEILAAGMNQPDGRGAFVTAVIQSGASCQCVPQCYCSAHSCVPRHLSPASECRWRGPVRSE